MVAAPRWPVLIFLAGGKSGCCGTGSFTLGFAAPEAPLALHAGTQRPDENPGEGQQSGRLRRVLRGPTRSAPEETLAAVRCYIQQADAPGPGDRAEGVRVSKLRSTT
jgi:hypothetical protein